jgi:hypothetical protein
MTIKILMFIIASKIKLKIIKISMLWVIKILKTFKVLSFILEEIKSDFCNSKINNQKIEIKQIKIYGKFKICFFNKKVLV